MELCSSESAEGCLQINSDMNTGAIVQCSQVLVFGASLNRDRRGCTARHMMERVTMEYWNRGEMA